MGTKADNYSFLKKLLENIKMTKDAQEPDSEEANQVCQNDYVCFARDMYPSIRQEFAFY